MIPVLYADGDEELLRIGKMCLELDKEFSVDTVRSAPEALEKIAQKTYDAIISGCPLHGMEAIAWVQQVRSIQDPVFFIIFTGPGHEETVIRALKDGADFYLEKRGDPRVQFAELARRIRNAVELRIENEGRTNDETDLECIIRRAPVGIGVTADRIVRSFNDQFCTITGYTADEIIGRPSRMLYPTEADFYYVGREIYEKRHGRGTVETRLKKKDGTIVDVLLMTNPLDPHDMSRGIIFTALDITRRKQADEALEKTKLQLTQAMDLADIATWEFDALTGIFTFNDKFYAMYGTTAEREGGYQMPAGVYTKEFVLPEEQHLVGEEVRKALNATDPGFVSRVEHRIVRRDGEVRNIIVRFSIIQDEDGRTIRTLGANQDITELKRAEEAVRDHERFLQRLIDTIQNPIFFKDKAGKYLGCNSAFERFIGIPKHNVIGKSVYDLSPKHLADIYYVKDQELILHPGTRTYDSKVRYADGSLRDVIFNKSTFFDAAGNPDGIVGVMLDITDRKHSEEALRRANCQLNLLGSITRHDIKNKLVVITGYVAIAEKRSQDPGLVKPFSMIRAATAAIQNEIEFTKIYQDLGTNEPQWQKLDQILPRDQVPADITFRCDCRGVEIYADPMLKSVFLNLLDNSIRHGEHVTEITVTSRERDHGLQVFWEDNGVGIPVEHKEKIFEHGFGTNTGLGMFLIREVLSLTDITISETGEPGKGARFEITVPRGMYQVKS